MILLRSKHYYNLTKFSTKSLQLLANKLYASGLITDDIKDDPTMNDIIEEFKAYLSISKDVSDVQSNCSKFLKAFITAGGIAMVELLLYYMIT